MRALVCYSCDIMTSTCYFSGTGCHLLLTRAESLYARLHKKTCKDLSLLLTHVIGCYQIQVHSQKNTFWPQTLFYNIILNIQSQKVHMKSRVIPVKFKVLNDTVTTQQTDVSLRCSRFGECDILIHLKLINKFQFGGVFSTLCAQAGAV